ncbi:MAG: aminotransferase class V-fold PLP-dependent enzyme, partial [Thermomicrobiales bacterium]|nr:aminotransferase class V-fold PLP-dependent enzyme [Thermomicrobiales bacterium]
APNATIAALDAALRDWQSGRAHWIDDWEITGERARSSFAELIGADVDTVALVPTVSAASGQVAASLPEGAHVLIADAEFTSVSFPFLAGEQAGKLKISVTEFDKLAEAIEPGIDLVAFSLTRSQSGETADLTGIIAAAKANGTKVFVDATHSIPFVSVREHLADIDFLACHGYKHLLCPRGAAFFVVRPERFDDLIPYLSNWYAGEPRYQAHYGKGKELSLQPSARRFDVSLAWHSWVGAAQSLALLVQWQNEGIFEGTWENVRRLATALELPEPQSTVITFKVDDADAAEKALVAAGIKCAARGGNIRIAPHVYNTTEEIDRAVSVLAPFR